MNSSEQYAREATKIVIAQVLKSQGFTKIEPQALHTLTDILLAYIDEIGFKSHQYTELAHRTESNFFDITAALEEVLCPFKSLSQYLQYGEELPFAHVCSSFPLKKKRRADPTPTSATPPPEYVPDFLPAFPAEHTYRGTAVMDVPDNEEIRRQRMEQRKGVESALASLWHARQQSKENEKNNEQAEFDDVPLNYDARNPFLAPPQQDTRPVSTAAPRRESTEPRVPSSTVEPSEAVVPLDDGSMPYLAPDPQYDEHDVVDRRRRANDLLATAAREAAQ